MAGQRKPKYRKAHCNKCSGRKNHEILWHRIEKDNDPVDHMWWGADHYALRCCGCDAISYESSSWDSEDVDIEGKPHVAMNAYPPKTFRAKPHWHGALISESFFDDKHFMHLLGEVYIALQNDCPRLAVMGIRALLEAIMIEKCGDNGSFGKNISAFEKQGHISATQKKALDPVIEAGHATIHRSFQPKSEEAVIALGVTENIIESIFVVEKRAARLKVPPRQKL